MPCYNLHYRFDLIVPGSGTIESLMANEGIKTVERHARVIVKREVPIEYDSDLVGIEHWLAEQHSGMFGCSNFQLLSWQPLVGEQRPYSNSN